MGWWASWDSTTKSARVSCRLLAQARSKIVEDIGGLGENHVAVFKDRRCVGGVAVGRVVEEGADGAGATAVVFGFAAHIHIIGARFFQGEADKLAAALDHRPVIQLVGHD